MHSPKAALHKYTFSLLRYLTTFSDPESGQLRPHFLLCWETKAPETYEQHQLAVIGGGIFGVG